MQRLPVIVSMGGINAAGRSSNHHAYKRLIIDSLDQTEANRTWQSLAALTNQETVDYEALKVNTLIRKLNTSFLKSGSYYHHPIELDAKSKLELDTRSLPAILPDNWQSGNNKEGQQSVHLSARQKMFLPAQRSLPVHCAGQLPEGFNPQILYQSRNHPRTLQMTVYAASDAIHSMGIDWQDISNLVAPDEVQVYAGSALAQLDYPGVGGLLQARLLGKRVTSKQLPLGFPEMPADFINAYLLGSVGSTGCNQGACASFLYNLKLAVQDIQSGRCRVAVVGNSEAPITAEIIEGFSTMGALATVKGLQALDHLKSHQEPDFRKACRPFAENCGFTLGESAQYIILMDDALAMETGAQILGAVAEVFTHADGYKKSISAPGVGNYISLARALASTQAILGKKSLQNNSFALAHGTGTPANRLTESALLSECAKTFDIPNWAVSGVKACLGHSISAAAGDQLMSALGLWQYGVLPSINPNGEIAKDVCQDNLDFITQNRSFAPEHFKAAIINSKGFGGNNASAGILSPVVVKKMLSKRYGNKVLASWQKANETVQVKQQNYEQDCLNGQSNPIYHFGKDVLSEEDINLSQTEIKIKSKALAINLEQQNPYADMF